jgi:hypothetical protein
MAKKTKAKKKVPQTFTQVGVACTSSSKSLKDAKISVGKDLFSQGIKGDDKAACMEAGTTTLSVLAALYL